MISQAKAGIRRLLPKNRFSRSISVLAGGATAGQIIVIMASPILTRLYSPEDFGVLAVFAAFLGILAVIASLRYELAIPLPESDEEAAHVVVLGLMIVAAMSLLTAFFVIFFAQPIADLFNTTALAGYLWLLPVGLLLSGIYQVFNYWAIRVKAFTPIARTKITQSIVMVFVQLSGYLLGPVSLIIGQITGQAAGGSSLAALTVRNRWAVFKVIHRGDIRAAARRYVRFPIYSTWSGLFNTTGQQLPPMLFAVLFSPAAAGIYMIAHRVLAMPMALIGKAIADVFFSSAAEARRNGTLAGLVEGIHAKLVQIAMPPALILILAGPDLFAFVFGADWRQAGEFAQWMAPWVYLVFITSPLSTLFSILEKQAQGMLFQGALLVTRSGGLILGAYLGDIMLAVALFAGGSAFCWLGFLVWILRASGNEWKALWRPALQSLALGALIVAPLAIFYSLSSDLGAGWFAAILASLLLTALRYTILLKRAW